ncbi:hypothetical protein HK107_01325 [Parvularcula sp. ZS-1/3]|uniref:Glycosyltransferase RgtA/B/C/D-like domain-containing protein n=1 Tax=Parvularcula mediterranea TaxID=2732508 RepID=A0A7Y3W3Z5_9PROT|nr:glycosyltransferase family 39 protein [Parvularcula mediterranea]NNU14963.1 hypothetical protein [Parvularcula mediterranea]
MTQKLFADKRLWALGVVLIGLVMPLRLALIQNTFIDEVTQLLGITLSPPDLFAWLLGTMENPFEAAPDRQPPLSYLVMQLFAALGFGETGLRFLGIGFSAAAAGFVFRAADETYGTRPALLVTFLMMTGAAMPASMTIIRPYPLFLLASAAAIYFAMRIFRGEERGRDCVWMIASCLAATYAHFFGMVLFGALTVGLAAMLLLTRQKVTATAVKLAVGWLLILPVLLFVLASFGVSKTEGVAPGFFELIVGTIVQVVDLLVFVLIGGGTIMSLPAVVLCLLGLTGLGAAFLRSAFDLVRENLRLSWPTDSVAAGTLGLALAVISGMGAIVLAHMLTVTVSFNALAGTYNLWLVPAVFVLLGLGLTGVWARVGLIGAGIMAAGRLLFILSFLADPTWLLNSPTSEVQRLLEDDPDALIAVGEEELGWTYYPFNLELPSSHRYFMIEGYEGEGSGRTYSHQEGYGPDATLPSADRVLFVEPRRLGMAQLARARRGAGIDCARSFKEAEAWAAENGYQVEAKAQHVGFLSACLTKTSKAGN